MSSTTVKNIDVEGVVLPNKPLTNFELIEAAKKLNIMNFRGFFMRDELPKKPRANECGILNLDDSSGKGTHWSCWIKVAKDKIYFDSYGLPPPTELLKYLERSSILQQRANTAGQRSLLRSFMLVRTEENNATMVVNFQEIINDLY